MSKVSYKILIKETRRLLRITNIEKKQIFECMENVIVFLRSSSSINENQMKVCSSFLATFMHLIKSMVKDNKIIEDEEDEEKYSDKLSTLLSCYINSEAQRMKLNAKDQTKSNSEMIFVDKVAVKCRVYGEDKSQDLVVKSLGKFFEQKDFHTLFQDVEVGCNLKLALNRLLKKIVNLRAPVMTINSCFSQYYHQIFVVWLKIIDDDKMRERIEKFALDHNLIIENGRLQNVRHKVQLELRNDCNTSDFGERKEDDDVFEHTMNYSMLHDLEWLIKLDKIPFSANTTVDLTVDSDDSDIEIQLLPAAELQLIEVDDDDNERELNQNKSFHEIPPLNSTRTNVSATSSNCNRICIQERRTYITSLNDREKPLSFMALRRRSIMMLEEERKKLDVKRRKSYAGSIDKIKQFKKSRTKSVDTKLMSNEISRSKLNKPSKYIGECYVSLIKISNKDLEKYQAGKLKISSLYRKYKKVKKKLVAEKKEPAKNKTRKKTPLKKQHQKPQVAKKSPTPNKPASYPDHTKPNLSLLQVLGKDIHEASVSTNKKRKRTSLKVSESSVAATTEGFGILRVSDDKSIRIVNVDHEGLEWSLNDHQYAHSPWIDPAANLEANSFDIISHTQIDETFDNISENEQNEDLMEPIVNTDLLEELLGPRASNYLPDVHASMNNLRLSNMSRSSKSAEDTPVQMPKKRNCTIKKSEPKTSERPKRERKKRNLDI